MAGRLAGTAHPGVRRPAAVVFAADHGVAASEVSAYPAEVTPAMLKALREGVATACVLARQVGATLDVVDVGVGDPTGDLTRASLDQSGSRPASRPAGTRWPTSTPTCWSWARWASATPPRPPP